MKMFILIMKRNANANDGNDESHIVKLIINIFIPIFY